MAPNTHEYPSTRPRWTAYAALLFIPVQVALGWQFYTQGRPLPAALCAMVVVLLAYTLVRNGER